MISTDRDQPGVRRARVVVAAINLPKGTPLSKGNREVRKPKTVKPKVIAAAAPVALSQTLAARKK
jgi:hypothetical protein